MQEPCSPSLCVCVRASREAKRNEVQVNVNPIMLCYPKTKNRTVKGYLCIQTSVTLKGALCWWNCCGFVFAPQQRAFKMPRKHGEYASSHPEPAQNALGSLGWMYFHVGSPSGSNGNMGNTTVLFGRNDLIGDAFIAKVSENGKCAGKRDVNGCLL